METKDLAKSTALKVTVNSTTYSSSDVDDNSRSCTKSGDNAQCLLKMYQDRTSLTNQQVLRCYECHIHTKDKTNDCVIPDSSTHKVWCNQNNCQAVIRSYTKVHMVKIMPLAKYVYLE